MKLRKRFVILFKMIRTEGLRAESFIKRASSTRMTGMRISIMEILLLMIVGEEILRPGGGTHPP